MPKLKITEVGIKDYCFQLDGAEEIFDCHEPLYGVMNWILAQGHGEMTLEIEHEQEDEEAQRKVP